MLGRNSAIVVEKVRAHMEKQMEEKADESP
jgi:hypothetical protein